MNGSLPRVSVIVPVFNGAAFLGEAIHSILAQNYAPLEIIVVDDGSTDDTGTVAANFGDAVTYVRQQNQGPAAGRNHGLRLATGELVSFLDADDRWPLGRLNHHVALLMQQVNVQLVIGLTYLVRFGNGAQGTAVPILPAPLVQHQVGSATYRRAIFDRIGGFDPDLRFGEDREWFQRALALDVALFITPEVALEYRVRPGSLSDGQVDFKHGFLAALRAHLNRRRAETGQSRRNISDTKTERQGDR